MMPVPDWSDPVAQAVAGVAALLLVLWLVRRRRAPGGDLDALAQGQQQLIGALTQIAEAQGAAQARLTRALETRLDEVQTRMGESLGATSTRTARALGALQERLEAIDRAQGKIEKLSGEVLGLQDILSNKQTRGAFGEIQLQEIVSQALPPDAYSFQATLSNGRRADCLIHMAHPPGPIVIDAKFPLESYEALCAAQTDAARARARAALKAALTGHIRDIAQRYILEGETAESALLFLPSEAVYAELHAHFASVVRAGFAARVWIVSPTTTMAVLHTLRGVMKDARLRQETGRIRRELALLHADLGRMVDRVAVMDRHFAQAAEDLEQVRISAEKAGRRAARLEAFDFDDLGGPPASEDRPAGRQGAR
jgi:DNA recombination protein RmuC